MLLMTTKHNGDFVITLHIPCSPEAFEEYARIMKANYSGEKAILIHDEPTLYLIPKKGHFELVKQDSIKEVVYRDAYLGILDTAKQEEEKKMEETKNEKRPIQYTNSHRATSQIEIALPTQQ